MVLDYAQPKAPQRGAWRPESAGRVQRRIGLLARALRDLADKAPAAA